MKYFFTIQLLFSACLAQQEESGQAQIPKGLRHRDLTSGDYYGSMQRNTFTSFFEVGYNVVGHPEDDLALIAQALAVSYNGLISKIDDPMSLLLEKVDIVEFGPADGDYRNGNAKALLAGIGSCDGCSEDTMFTMSSRGKSKGGKKGGSVMSLPSEDEVRQAYEVELRSLDVDIAAVPFLSEVRDSGDLGDDSGKGGKGSKKGKGDGDDSDKGGKGTKKGEGDEDDSGKGGKGTKKGKGNEDDSGKGGKGAKKGKGDEDDFSKGGKKGKKDSKKSGKGEPKPTCPPVEPVGTQSGQFESFFDSTYGLLSDSTVGLEDAVSALTIAYNRVAALFAADIRIEESDIFDALTGRRLSFAEADLRRKLQFSLNIVIRVIGVCTLCERNLTVRNQVSDGSAPINIGGGGLGILPGGRRLTEEDEEELVCPRPGLPTAEEVRLEYNVVLEEIRLRNINECLELVEIDRPKPPKSPKSPKKSFKGKNKGKAGTRRTS